MEGCDLGSQGGYRIHWLLLSDASETDLIVCRKACPRMPRSFSNLMVDEATNPLHPTSTG
ncbi:hypothetical protein F2P79_022755 [Pimephales promelas]|nr:hypothetical protein F2P79_022755 [Pimephales promelas]